MGKQLQKFLSDSENKAFDLEHRRKLNFNISKYLGTVKQGVQQYDDMELAKKRAKNIKWKVMEHLDKYLIEFEKNFTANGGKVIWAADADEANEKVKEILKAKNARKVVKSKSMATEEIRLNHILEDEGIEVNETDLGEFIVQLAGEPPYHIVTPAMHKSKEDVGKLFHEKFGTPLEATPEELTMEARKILRNKYIEADVGITGGNFMIADSGAIAVTENEGNARLTTAFPKTHIAIIGIEKMIPSVEDLSHYWPLLATYGTGQNVTVFNTIFSGPRQQTEDDGPEEMYVVLLDNGRSKLLAQPEKREALYCIRCGACLNVCPVYKNVGGHTYSTTYSGPIGSVISPHYKGMKDFRHLSYASSLCGNCTEVCPVKIDLHKLLMLNRKDVVESGMNSKTEKWGYYFWKKGMLNRKLMNFGSAKMKNFVLRYLFKDSWGKRRELPEVAEKSFNQLWKERKKR